MVSTARRETILVIENDPALGAIVEELLVEEGYRVRWLKTPEAGRLRAELVEVRPDCILLDGIGSDYGVSWEEAAWAQAHLPGTRIIMFTANAAAIQEALEGISERSRTIDSVVPKPFDVDALLETLDRAMQAPAEPYREARAGTPNTVTKR